MKRGWMLVALLLPGAGSVRAEDDLETRIRDLEIRGEAAAAPASAPAGPGLSLVFDRGFRLRAGEIADIRIGGHVIAHAAFYSQSEDEQPDTFRMKEAHLILEATFWKRWELYVEPDLQPGNSALFQGWAEFNGWDLVRVRAGVMRVPYSEETLEPTPWQDFPENSLTELSAPARDIGLLVHGLLFEGIFDYAVGVFNGNGFDNGRDENSGKDVAGYLGISPFRTTGWDWLRRFRLGFSGTDGRHRGAADQLPIEVKVPASQSDFQTNRMGKVPGFDVVTEDGTRQRASGELSVGIGPFELATEYSLFRTMVEAGGDRSAYRSYANHWSVGFWLGGSRDAGKRPKIDSSLFFGGVGAIQLVARYSKIKTDDVFVDRGGFAGTNSVREYSVGVNWYPNDYVRISLMFTDIRYGGDWIPVGEAEVPKGPVRGPNAAPLPYSGSGGNAVFAHHIDEEKVLLVRLQVDF